MLTILPHLHSLLANNLQLHGHPALTLVQFREMALSPQGTIAARPD